MKIRTKLFLGFEIILTLLVIVILISYANSNKLIDDTNWIIHTEEVLVELKGIVAHLTDAETGQRGYIITGEDRYLEPYDNSLIKISHSIDYLKELTEDNPTQQEYIKLLEPLINDKLGELKETIGLRKYVDFDSAREVVLSDQGKDIMDEIRQLVDEMTDEEKRLLMLRSQVPEESKQRTNMLLIALLIFGIAIGGGIAGYISISISNPLKKLISVTQELGKGNLDVCVNVKTGDELEILGRSFNETAKKLGEIDEMKDELISVVTHELRTPLTSITSLSKLIQDKKMGPVTDRQKESLGVISKDGNRLTRLVTNLMDVQKIDSGKIEYSYSKFNFRNLVNVVLKNFSEEFKGKNISVELKSKVKSSFINADKARMTQVLINLFENAVKYGKRDGHIWITITKDEDNLVVEVKDDGMGISKKDVPRLFTRMFQAKGAYQRIAGGVGFGLYISKRIVEDGHGGKVWVKSVLDKGSSFYFSLPLKLIKIVKKGEVRNE